MKDGLIPETEALFDPDRFKPQFSDAHIISHLTRTLRIVRELDESEDGIPHDLRVHVFGVVQAMCSSMSPIEQLVSEKLAIPNGRRR